MEDSAVPTFVTVTVAPATVAPSGSFIVTMRLPLDPCAAIARPDPIDSGPVATIAIRAMKITTLRVVN